MLDFDRTHLYAQYRVYVNNSRPGTEFQRCAGLYRNRTGVAAVFGGYRYDISKNLPSDIENMLAIQMYDLDGNAQGDLVVIAGDNFNAMFAHSGFVLDHLTCAGLTDDNRLLFFTRTVKSTLHRYDLAVGTWPSGEPKVECAQYVLDTESGVWFDVARSCLAEDGVVIGTSRAVLASCLPGKSCVAWRDWQTGRVVLLEGGDSHTYDEGVEPGRRIEWDGVGTYCSVVRKTTLDWTTGAWLDLAQGQHFDYDLRGRWTDLGTYTIQTKETYTADSKGKPVADTGLPDKLNPPGGSGAGGEQEQTEPWERLVDTRAKLALSVTPYLSGFRNPMLEFGLFTESRFFNQPRGSGVSVRLSWEHQGYGEHLLPFPTYTSNLHRFCAPVFGYDGALLVADTQRNRLRVLASKTRGYVFDVYQPDAAFPHKEPEDGPDEFERTIEPAPDYPLTWGNATMSSGWVSSINMQPNLVMQEDNAFVCNGKHYTVPARVAADEALVYGAVDHRYWSGMLGYRSNIARNVVLSVLDTGKAVLVMDYTTCFRPSDDAQDRREMASSVHVRKVG